VPILCTHVHELIHSPPDPKRISMSDLNSTSSETWKSQVSHGFSTSSGSAWFTSKAGGEERGEESVSALEALATLASSAHKTLNTVVISGSSDEDSESMPPPPPRHIGRMRSVSNPEGMEKWGSCAKSSSSRRHFVLPSSILEEELASANDACKAHAEQMARHSPTNDDTGSDLSENSGLTIFSVNTRKCTNAHSLYGTSPDSVTSPIEDKVQEEESEEVDSNLDPEELLRRARNKLFDDLSAEQGLEKGVMPLPHSLDKYQEVYNKNGRIGIYTPLERAAIIAKFNSKRTRRVWNKKIRYSCRKNLADRRMRVKGRFVKRSVDYISIEVQKNKDPSRESMGSSSSGSSSGSNSPLPSAPSGPLEPVFEENDIINSTSEVSDVDMPDVSDPDAGFRPTASQPYRRTRRHTIT